MASKKAKIIDKWKSKKWYQVVAPSLFEGREICEVVGSDDHLLLNRVVRTSLMDLGLSASGQTGMFTTLDFRIIGVNGTVASTRLIGHTIASSYTRTFARRGKSLIHSVVDAKTKDNEQVRIKVVAVTNGRVSATVKKNLRYAIQEEVKNIAALFTYDEFMLEILHGRISSKLFNRLKKITMMRRAEVRKSERKEEFK